MGAKHDRAARRIAHQCGGTYDPTRSPDVQCRDRAVEVKTRAGEIPKALDQLGRPRKLQYVALPASQHPAALARLKGTGVGLMDHNGNIVKRARRS